ncbi:hypothetical protein [Paenibacillus shenyangensis]|uniref:hypothetical protein n=1 Tax=Paenibacillus sp. A9 TaxID=1284352 RepID=UPI000380945D|nr:hypothetical protein [Paenibacillus sp. A9]
MNEKNPETIPDQNCTLCTIAGLHIPTLTPYQVFEQTGYMDGPPHDSEAISAMLVTMKMSDGSYERFATLEEAERAMLQFGDNQKFCVGYASDQDVGHMVAAQKAMGGMYYYDFQNSTPAQLPTSTGYKFYVWPIYS